MKKAIVIYDTRTGATGAIARLIEEELKVAGIEVESRRILEAEEEGYDLVEAVKNADAVIVGSPTYYNDLFSPVKDFLLEMEKADLKGKIGAAFGSYGWSGEAVKMIADTMKNAFKMNVIEPGLKVEGRPGGSSIVECKLFGKTVAERINRGY
jgi:flavorubredoxin